MMNATGTIPKPKPDHLGVAGPAIGPHVYLIVRHDGKMVGVENSRHDAAWVVEQLHDCDDYSIEYVPVGSIPLVDLNKPKVSA